MSVKGIKGTGTIDDEFYDAWKIGSRFTYVKYLIPLKEFGDAQKVARFGHVENVLPESDQKTENRFDGLQKMHHILTVLIYDIKFAMNKYTRIKLAGQKNRLDLLKKHMDKVVVVENDMVRHMKIKKINEKMFDVVYYTLLDINSWVLTYMNQRGLIFPVTESFDVEEIMADIVHRG